MSADACGEVSISTSSARRCENQVSDGEPDATAVLESSQPGEQCEPTAPEPHDAIPVVPVPVPAHVQQPKPRAPAVTAGPEQQQQAQQQQAPSATTPSHPSEPPLSHAEGQEGPRTTLQRILHALRPGRRKASRAQNAAEISEPAAGARPAAIVVVLDLVLSLINRPFAFLSPGARHVVGLVAIVTLAIAAVTAALAPLAPKNDAVTFIRQKRAELDQPPPPPAAQSEKPQAENAHGAGH